MGKLEIFRAWMREEGLDGFIVPSGDNHFNEYTQTHFACRAWISGFTGSAGTAVITETGAALWADSRYFVQAAEQLQGSGMELMKIKVPGVPSIAEWLKSSLAAGAKIGMDPALFSVSEYNMLKADISPLTLIARNDPFDRVWDERPPVEFKKIRMVPLDISGMGTKDKLELIKRRVGIETGKKFRYILSTCDDIMWLCNIRGEDIAYNPVALSFAVITEEGVTLFVKTDSVGAKLMKELNREGITVKDYCEFENYIGGHDCVEESGGEIPIVVYPAKTSLKVFNMATGNGVPIVYDNIPGGVVAFVKAAKNAVEAEGFRRAMVMDGVAWVKSWMFLEKELEAGNVVTENSVAESLIKFRSEYDDYIGESFTPIVAYGKNAALPHYSSKGKDDVEVLRDNYLLIDTGAQYIYGTTDTTRTIALGNITLEQKRDYTAVLKGMIDLSSAVFPKGTKGSALDMLARGPVCSAGRLYLHGTGHGVGHNLCVHEGPQSIRMEDNPVEFMPGMVTSNEPGIYIEGRYGVRIENIILCVLSEINDFGEFYRFETLTQVPIDKSIIDTELLGSSSLKRLNEYHSEVYRKLSPFLNDEEKAWLSEKCSELR